MLIDLFLLAGITTSYLSSKKTSIKRDQYSILEDNGRLALEIITKTLEHTGYATSKGNPLSEKFITAGVSSKSCNDGSVSVLDTSIFPNPATADDKTSDSIGVVYLGDADITMDCSGEEIIASCQIPNVTQVEAAKIYSAFFIDKTDATQPPKLQCAGSRNTEVQTIAEGVENMQILYGVDVNGDNTVERYVSEADIGGLWDDVISIQVGLLMRSLREVNDKATKRKFSLLDTEISKDDRYQRAVFSTTISLRNALN
jgi:type IV pilus assembly protein PilW